MLYWRMLIVALMGVFSYNAHAEVKDCDPAGFKRLVLKSTDLRTNILYAKTLQSQSSGSGDSSIGIDIPGYANLSGSQRQQYLDSLSKIVNLNISDTDKKFLFISEIDPKGKDHYLACIQGRPIYIIPPAVRCYLMSSRYKCIWALGQSQSGYE
jgi:hypothetical protein